MPPTVAAPRCSFRLREGRSWAAAATVLSLFALAGCETPPKPLDFAPLVPRFLMEAPAEAPGVTVIELPVSQVRIPVYARPVMTELEFANVELVRVDLGLCLMFECTVDGARNLFRLSSANLGRRLVLTLNGAPFGARLFEGPLQDGRLFIFVEMKDADLTNAALDLKRTVQEVQAARARGEDARRKS